ncbi:CPBP family intramembrane glutamic endopeptidase [Promicromonospora iranensis]|uniref:Membrane protease YdiL (CAAX protease family) n=1 Tax=Promicromonospora iranensis TaxID=1105144 RepID=A0ABU2CKN7_9MICO|nr:CPBP family intramembrane glutamic endopeptidase [Promicromonospora iranensis]MDR7381912.1 membrane protease YdiL (CAAX protease family) [Promicromonospora iranensis]
MHTDPAPVADRAAGTCPAPYVQGLRTRPGAHLSWWRSALAVLAGLTVLALSIFVLAGPSGGLVDRLLGLEPFDPARPEVTVGFWLVGNLLLGALVPVSGLVQRVCNGVRLRWLSSVEGRFRWTWFGRLVVHVAPVWAVLLCLVWTALPSGPLVLSPETFALVAVAVLTVPLQSAGEEYLFRGLVSRAVGSLFARTGLAVVASTVFSAALFTVVHGSFDPFALLYYFAAAVGFSAATHVSGGLEAAVLVHGLSNTLLLTLTILTGGLGGLAAVTGPVLLVPTFAMLVLPVYVRWLARRYDVVTTG